MAVVTGWTKGIGRAIIERLASERFDIITCSRNLDELNSLRESVQNAYNVRVEVFAADLALGDQVRSFGRFVKDIQQPLDVLVNNVGNFIPRKVTEEREGSLDNIRVTSVLPGATRTPSWDGDELPEERFVKPKDIAASVFSAYSLSHRTVVEEILIQPQLGDF
jgi:short-subunit dehydrogenase